MSRCALSKGKDVILFGSWAHARHGLVKAKDQEPHRIAGWILRQISWLYHWESELRRKGAGAKEREMFRASHHRMVVERIKRVLDKLQFRFRPRSLMGEAISYAFNQWPSLVRFLEHGDVEIDNSLVENAIRPTAVGKKNWLFFGSEESGQRSAVIYTLIENCRMHGIDPLAYLKDVLTRLPNTSNQQIGELTPLNWKQAREVQIAKAA